MTGIGIAFLPLRSKSILFRLISHEFAHAAAARMGGGKVKKILLKPTGLTIRGSTDVEGLTPQAAMKTSVAGVATDIGFNLASFLLWKKITLAAFVLFSTFDVVSFFVGTDYSNFKIVSNKIE